MQKTEETILADMSLCEPASALSAEQKTGLWLLVDYETEDGVKGVMMYADSRQEPPSVTLPLGVTGWHKIFIGVNYTRTAMADEAHLVPWTMWGSLRVKLSTDKSYCRIAQENPWRKAQGCYDNKMGNELQTWTGIFEVYWKSADLAGQSLIFATPPVGPHSEDAIANVSWVRLLPMTDEDIQQAQQDLPTPKTKRLAAEYCLGQLTGHTFGNQMYHPTDPTYITDMIEPYRDSDFRILMWECIRGDICAYKTKINRFGWTGQDWDPSWVDPLEVAVEYAHDCGLELYIAKRMIGPGFPFKQSQLQQNDYYYNNKQYAMKDEEGRDTSILSIAYPEIREHWVSLLRESVRYGADGVHLILTRTNPFCLYEEPVSDTFQQEYGIDPRTLPFEDERWLKHRASFLTQYLRDVRRMLDEEAAAAGEHLGLAVTYWRRDYPLYYAYDLQAWATEQLVDILIPHWIHIAVDDGPAIVRQIKDSLAGTEVQLWPDIFPRTAAGEAYPEKLKAMYDAGADGFAFWSSELRSPRASEWAVLKRMGHYDQMDRYQRTARQLWRRVPLRELGSISTHHSHTDG